MILWEVGVVTKGLEYWTPDQKVWVQALARYCVLGQGTYTLTVPHSDQVYKWVQAKSGLLRTIITWKGVKSIFSFSYCVL